EGGAERGAVLLLGAQPQAEHHRLARRDLDAEVERRLGARGIRRVEPRAAAHHALVERVLHPRAVLLDAEQPGAVGAVLGEQQARRAAERAGTGVELEAPEALVPRQHRVVPAALEPGLRRVALAAAAPV